MANKSYGKQTLSEWICPQKRMYQQHVTVINATGNFC